MERKKTSENPPKKGADREKRLKAALKANMARRKSQARARSDQGVEQSQNTQEE
ncbi:hypothetical protein [Aliiroseovarius sp. 2305UL8-7]|uniref:hypothetical protein n=1 Tax=Aliiroseovarius conchicola TaxID=3121637 RepID=UPI00352966DF